MAVEISLVRHAETAANVAGVWQGTSDSPLSEAGRDQIERLGRRFAAAPFDLVVTSDIGRARETSRALGGTIEVDKRWRELHLGDWEGLSRREITELDPDAVAALGSGDDVAFGGGERVSEMIARLIEAFRDVSDRVSDGERALVVSHGGALLTLIGTLLGVDARGRLLRLTNTGVTTFLVDGTDPELRVFNDSTHLLGAPVRADPGATHVVLVRHGESVGNREGRWQGRTGGELTSEGCAQASSLGARFPRVDALYSSPLGRAWETALFLADGNGLAPQSEAGLEEMAFGSWEMLTTEEIEAADPEGYAALRAGIDVARGGTGETFSALQDRITKAVAGIAARHEGGTVGVVSHGAATRAFTLGVLGLDFDRKSPLSVLGNTAMARVVYGPQGPTLATWNVARHLWG